MIWRVSKKIALLGLLCIFALAFFRVGKEWVSPPYDEATTTLFREESGDGNEVFVLVHGLSGSAQFWRGRTAPLEKRGKVILVDLLGFGDSPMPDASYDLPQHVAALKRVIQHELDTASNVTLIGHSLGALVVAKLASEVERPLEAVLASMPVYRSSDEAKEKLSTVSAMHRGMVNESFMWRLSCYFMDVWRLPIFQSFSDVPIDVHLSSFSHTWPSLSRTLHNAIMKSDVSSFGRLLQKHRVTMLHHEDDQVAPIENARWFAGLANARFEDMGAGGHNGFLRDPDAYWRRLKLKE